MSPRLKNKWSHLFDADEARALWRYEPETGILYWRVGQRVKGKPAGSNNGVGYICVKYKGHMFRRSRIVWLLVTGEWPQEEIDHRNNIYDDDRFENLRLATREQNNRNQRIRKDNVTGFKGVSLCRGKYQVTLASKYIGVFTSIEEAKEVYRKAAEQKFGEFARI